MTITSARRAAPPGQPRKNRDLSKSQFRQLSEFRYQLRRFLHFSQEAAEEAGLRPQQYQLLLAVQGMGPAEEPTIANVAARLMLRHNSAVELVDRTIELGHLYRTGDPHDHRRILLRITPQGERMLHSLAEHHLTELEEAGPELIRALGQVIDTKFPGRDERGNLREGNQGER